MSMLMSPVEKQILTNQTAIMNALTGLYALKKIDEDPIGKTQKNVRDKITESIDSTILVLSKATLVTAALLEKEKKNAQMTNDLKEVKRAKEEEDFIKKHKQNSFVNTNIRDELK